MGAQVWQVETIENILWTIQTTIQATSAISTYNGPIAYGQGYENGLEAGVKHTLTAFEGKPLGLKVWPQIHIRNILLSVQSELQVIITASANKSQSMAYKQGFNRGYETALWCIASSFGVNLDLLGEHSAPGRDMSPSFFGPWFREDIKNALRALQKVIQLTKPNMADETDFKEYHRGFEDGLKYIADTFGLRLLIPAGKQGPGEEFTFWARNDIEKKLLAAYRTIPASTRTFKNKEPTSSYWQGIEAALQCIATFFGVNLLA